MKRATTSPARPLATWRRVALAALCVLPLARAAGAADMPTGESSPIADASAQALWWGEFDQLEAQYAAVRDSVEFTDGGTLRLQWFRVGIARVFNQDGARDPYYAQLEAMTRAWSVEHPRSALAQLLYARALYGRGVQLRGSDYRNKTPAASLREFKHYLGLAEAQIIAHADVLKGESTANVYMVTFGRWNWPFERLHDIAVDGLAKNRADNGAWEELAGAALPRWGGSPELFDAVAREAGRRVAGYDGKALYAFLYDTHSDSFEGELFGASRVDWPTMRQGFRDYLARYPNAYMLNRFAMQACVAEDKPTTLDLLEQIGAHPSALAWGNRLDACRRWAHEQ